MVKKTPNDWLSALAADLNTQRRLLPCAALIRQLERPGRHMLRSDTVDRALLLAAVYDNLAECLLADFGSEHGGDPSPQRWRQKLQPIPQKIVARRLALQPVQSTGAVILPIATHCFLAGLPLWWVREILIWAPPVISRLDAPDSPAPVIENVFSAFLASRVIPNEKVSVRVLTSKTHARFNVVQLAALAAPVLSPLCRTYRNRIVCLAPNLAIARHLTGLSRAMVARIRQEQGRAAQ